MKEKQSKQTPVYLGIDGGGTKTDFALCDENGVILRRVGLEGSNPTNCGMKETLRVIDRGITALGVDDCPVRAVFAGIAGCPDNARRGAIVSALKKRFPDAAVDADADIVNVIYAARHKARCVAAICGTGSVAFAMNEQGLFRVGGWGPLFDTAGSGYDIGRDAVRAALAEEDGFGERTPLTAAVRKKLGTCVFDGAASLPQGDPAVIASFAPLVFEEARRGDPTARAILRDNFARLAFLINTAARLYGCREQVILAGGITAEEEALNNYLLPLLDGIGEVAVVRDAPIVGALNKARALKDG